VNFVNSVNFPGTSAFVLHFLQNISRRGREVNEVNRVNKRDSGLIAGKTTGEGGFLTNFLLFLMNMNELMCTYMRLSLRFAMGKKAMCELGVNLGILKFTRIPPAPIPLYPPSACGKGDR
jgi:hypothetical protein